MLAEGWAIVWGPKSSRPGWVEMAYFGMKSFRKPVRFRDPLPGDVITPEEWCDMYRPGCKFVRVQVVEKTNE